MEYVLEFKYLGCVLDEAGADEAECSRKVARDLQLECARILHETLLIPVLMYGSEIILWKEKKRRYRMNGL